MKQLVRRFFSSNALRKRPNLAISMAQATSNHPRSNQFFRDTHQNKFAEPATSSPILKFDELKAIYQKQPKQAATVSFENFEEIPGLAVELLAQMNNNGIFKPTDIQKSMLGHFFSSPQADLLIKSQPGSGKSLGYIIMLLAHHYATCNELKAAMTRISDKISSKYLVIVPSELLAKQLVNWLQVLSQSTSLKVSVLCETFEKFDANSACDFLVATPEAFRTKLAQGAVELRGLHAVVLDEADALIKPLKRFASSKQKDMRAKHPVVSMMLLSEMMKAISANKLLNRPRMIVSSATLNKLTRDQLISAGIVKDAIFLDDKKPIVTRQENLNPLESKVRHFHSLLSDPESPDHLVKQLHRIVTANEGKLGAIFLPASQSKLGLCELLKSSPEFSNHSIGLLCNYRPASQDSQQQLLIASDIDCRGIDIPELSYVVILDLPSSTDSYIHMAGRVGRTGQNSGNVYTILGTSEDFNRFTSLIQNIPLTSIPFLE